METVGVRELKDHLAQHLRTVRRGKTVVVTVRGRPVARLVPIAAGRAPILPMRIEKRLWELAAEGFLAWNGEPFRLPEAVAVNDGPELLSDLVVQDRE